MALPTVAGPVQPLRRPLPLSSGSTPIAGSPAILLDHSFRLLRSIEANGISLHAANAAAGTEPDRAVFDLGEPKDHSRLDCDLLTCGLNSVETGCRVKSVEDADTWLGFLLTFERAPAKPNIALRIFEYREAGRFEEMPNLFAIVVIDTVLTTEPQMALAVNQCRYLAWVVQPMLLSDVFKRHAIGMK